MISRKQVYFAASGAILSSFMIAPSGAYAQSNTAGDFAGCVNRNGELFSLQGGSPYQAAVPEGGLFLLGMEQEQAGQIQLSVDAVQDEDPFLLVTNEAGELLAFNDDAEGLNARASLSLDAGSYCIAAGILGWEGGAVRVLASQAGASDGGGNSGTPPISQASSEGACERPEDIIALGELTSDGAPLQAAQAGNAGKAIGFTLSEASGVRIQASNENADPVIRLYGVNSQLIDENDDHNGLNSQITQAELAAGEYCLEVTALSNDSLAIAVEIETIDREGLLRASYAEGELVPLNGEYPVNDLGVLETNLNLQAFLGEGAYWGKFMLSEFSLVRADAREFGGIDPFIRIFNGGGAVIAENDDGPEGLSSQLFVELPPGEYYFMIRPLSGEAQSGVAAVPAALKRYLPAGTNG